MATDVLNQTFFGIYEFFANIIPGTVVLLTILLMVDSQFFLPSSNTIITDGVFVVVFAFLAFIIGLAIQGISSSIEKFMNNKKYGGYPSSLYLKEADNTFPKYFKNSIRDITKEKFGTPADAPDDHIFDLCYSYVMQNKVSERVPQFLRTYTFSRNMMVTVVIEAPFFFFMAYQQQQIWFLMAGLGFLSLSYVFYKRFLRYGESFAKEVFRSFFIDNATKEASGGTKEE